MIAAAPTVDRLQLDERSWIDIVRGFLPPDEADALRDELRESTSWVQGKVWRYEKYVPEPRLGAMQVGARRSPQLVEAQDWIQRRYKVLFDSLALAWYRNELDSVGWHRDRELKWLDDTVIGVLTLGQQRPFTVKRNSGRGQRDDSADSMAGAMDLSPASGDLLVMGGRCQTDWLHAVPKSDRAMRDRISVQWRWTSKRGRPDTAPSFYDRREFSKRR